jgi:hypothetical protein
MAVYDHVRKTGTMQQLRTHPRVEHVDDHRKSGDGIIVTMRAGWSMDPLQDNRVFGEDTPSAALKTVRRARPYHGRLDA